MIRNINFYIKYTLNGAWYVGYKDNYKGFFIFGVERIDAEVVLNLLNN